MVQSNEDPSSSQWCGSSRKSLKGAASPDHLSLFFTWCHFSRSPLLFLYFVRLFSKKNLSRCGLSRLLFFFFFFFSFSHLPLQRSPSSSTFPTKSSLSQNSHFFLNKTLNITPQNPCNAFQNLFVSFLKVKFIQPTINVISILPMYAPPCPKNHLFSLKHAATLSPSSLNVDPLSVYLMA